MTCHRPISLKWAQRNLHEPTSTLLGLMTKDWPGPRIATWVERPSPPSPPHPPSPTCSAEPQQRGVTVVTHESLAFVGSALCVCSCLHGGSEGGLYALAARWPVPSEPRPCSP